MTPQDPPSKSSVYAGIFCALLAACLFSLKPILVKLAYRWPIDAATLLGLRMLMALPFYLVIGGLAWRRRPAPVANMGRLSLRVAAVGLLGYYAASFLDLKGLEVVPAQLERIIIYTYPIMIAVLGVLFFGATHQRRTWFALGCSYLGILIMFVSDLRVLGPEVWGGTGFVVASAFCFAFYTLFSKRLIDTVGTQLFTCLAMSAASLAIGVHVLLAHPLSDLLVPMPVVWIVLGIAIACTVVPSFLFTEAVRRIGPARTSIVGGVGPASSAVLAVFLLGEAFTVWHGLGTGLAIAGVLWLVKGR